MTAVAAVSGAHVAGGPRLLGILLAGYLVLGQSVVGGWSHARFRRMLGRDPRALLSRYRRTAVVEWSLVAVALALVAAAPGLGLADIGVRWPRLSDGGAPFTMVGLGGLGLSVLLLAALRSRVDGGVPVTAPVEVLALLPRSTRERRAFAAVAVTAGVCEETLYRGVLLAVAAALAPRLPAFWLAVLSAVAFGLAHAYQGAFGVLTTTVLGGCLAVLYLGSGSLLLPVLYHVLVDLRVLVLAVGQHTPGRHTAYDDAPSPRAPEDTSRRISTPRRAWARTGWPEPRARSTRPESCAPFGVDGENRRRRRCVQGCVVPLLRRGGHCAAPCVAERAAGRRDTPR